jgi:hypothetical protein
LTFCPPGPVEAKKVSSSKSSGRSKAMMRP